MVSRKALVVANPGEDNAENYCEGVNKDVNNYKAFLKSPTGGLWYESEIYTLYKPTRGIFRKALQQLKDYDYALVIYSGHGWYSASDDSTILELGKDENIDSVELRNCCKKQTLILDCCRKVEKVSIFEVSLRFMAAKSTISLNEIRCRHYYDELIEVCDPTIIVMFACAINEKAGDNSQKGGYYSASLIRGAMDWADGGYKDLSKHKYSFSIVEAHTKASVQVKQLSGGRQNPVIEKPRSGQYFPFTVMA